MSGIDKLSEAAKIIAQQLDEMDNDKKGMITAENWNVFVKDKGGREISSFFSREKAEKSIAYYLTQNAAKENIDVNDLAQRWINANDEIIKQKIEANNKKLEQGGFVLRPKIPADIADLLKEEPPKPVLETDESNPFMKKESEQTPNVFATTNMEQAPYTHFTTTLANKSSEPSIYIQRVSSQITPDETTPVKKDEKPAAAAKPAATAKSAAQAKPAVSAKPAAPAKPATPTDAAKPANTTKTKSTKTTKATEANPNIGKYKQEFPTYTAKTDEQKLKYDRVLNRITKNPNLLNKDDAKYIANMVCTLADRYGIDAEIVENIIERESQFQFTPKVMQKPGSKYKGVAQVALGHIKAMYYDKNTLGLSTTDKRFANDHAHYANDQARIDQLKKSYPTPESLYKAIQSDVSLGLEVGIMAYKGLLSMKNGNTIRAMAMYCGSQYKLPADSLKAKLAPIPQKYHPIPTYRA